MATQDNATKRVAINKANARMVIVVAVASFITVFCLVASKTVLSQNQYQARVTTAKEQAHTQLQANAKTFASLTDSYNNFDNNSTNIIGGSKSGSGDNDGDNAKIILDALPPKYDFPGLTSSVEKLLSDRGFHAASLSGTDDQINQQTNLTSPSPQPVPMPFSFSVNDISYSSAAQLVQSLQSSIRPIQIDTMSLSGSSGDLTISITAHTYYQPAKSISITNKVVK